MKIVVTGANGFAGRPICEALTRQGHQVVAIVRRASSSPPVAHLVREIADLASTNDLSHVLQDADALVHLAARTHQLGEQSATSDALYEAANVALTERLVMAAIASRVRRIVFVSSIKVCGEVTRGKPFSAITPPAPEDAYGRSKARAEQRLREVAGNQIETVILRPPLMYGEGVRGNIALLLKSAQRGWPLPIASIENRRDLLGVRNFAELVTIAASHPAAAGEVFLARDGSAVSTPELYAAIANAAGRAPRMIPVPVEVLKLAGRISGKSGAIRRLIGDLEVDDSETRRVLSWQPKVFMHEELLAAAERFNDQI